MLNTIFDKIYCVNLDRRIDRWQESQSLFKAFNVDVTRISGIEDTIPWNGLRLTIIGIFKEAIEKEYKRIVIFEDDVDWDSDFNQEFSEAWSALPDDWHMLYFSAAHQYWPQQHNNKLFKLSWSTAAHAIAFNSSCFLEVLKALESNIEPVDVIYAKLQPRLNAYCCIDPIAWQRKSFSDIEGQEKWYPYLKDIGFYQRYSNGEITIDGKEIINTKQD